ncbi:hypothetical protein Scep_012419 [Stephania cephalantha]|uniref:Uncharacterized protein n=1 Tax=Stephania cephalantha TaxID=152367 RepID=A0AAP0JEW5_9MAGN
MDGTSHGGGADLWLHSSGEARIAETAREKRRKDNSALTVAAAQTPATMARR